MNDKLRQAISEFISDGDSLTSEGFCAMSVNLPAVDASGERLLPFLIGPVKDALVEYLRWLNSQSDGYNVSKLSEDYEAIRKQLVGMLEADLGSATTS